MVSPKAASTSAVVTSLQASAEPAAAAVVAVVGAGVELGWVGAVGVPDVDPPHAPRRATRVMPTRADLRGRSRLNIKCLLRPTWSELRTRERNAAMAETVRLVTADPGWLWREPSPAPRRGRTTSRSAGRR